MDEDEEGIEKEEEENKEGEEKRGIRNGLERRRV
jgi:hypothetical protein